MPKAKATQGGTKQVTISKFFAPKQGCIKQVNGVQIVTDEDDDTADGNEVMVKFSVVLFINCIYCTSHQKAD